MHGWRQRRSCYLHSRRRVVGRSEGVENIWSTAEIAAAAARTLAASGDAAYMVTAARESEASGSILAMAMSEGYDRRLAAAETAALGSAVARATEAGRSKQG